MVDPEVTNPNAPWVSTKSSDFGSACVIIARVLLQAQDMVGCLEAEDRDNVLRQLHACKESLLACEKVRIRITDIAESIIADISKNGLYVENGRHIKDLPQIPNLEDDASSFLINIKRAIVGICYLANCLLPLPKKNNNLEHLKKSLNNLNDRKYEPLIKTIDNFVPGAKYFVDLRNYQEHPDNKITHIENFTINSKNEIVYPVWYLTGQDPESIVASMKSAIEYLVSLSEGMLIHYLLVSPLCKFPLYVQEIPEKEINVKIPIRYRLQIDLKSMKIQNI